MPSFFAGGLHHVREIQHRELLRELVVDAALAARGRILAGNFDATHGVANIQKAARLSALAVHRQRLPDGRLHAKAVEHRAKHIVVVKAIDERLIEAASSVIVPYTTPWFRSVARIPRSCRRT